jgi:hypothetical protein
MAESLRNYAIVVVEPLYCLYSESGGLMNAAGKKPCWQRRDSPPLCRWLLGLIATTGRIVQSGTAGKSIPSQKRPAVRLRYRRHRGLKRELIGLLSHCLLGILPCITLPAMRPQPDGVVGTGPRSRSAC